MSDVGCASTPPNERRRSRAGHRLLPSTVVVATVVASVLLPSRAGADPVSNSQNNLNHVTNQLQAEQAQAAQIESALQAQGARLDILAQQYETDQQQVQTLDGQLDALKAQITVTEAHIAATQAQLRRDALQSYMSGATDNSFDSIFSSGGEQAAVTQEYQNLAGANLTNEVDVLHQEQASLGVQQAQVQATEAQARAALAEASNAQQQAQAVAAQQQSELNQAKGQVATLLAQQQQARQQLAAAQYAQQLAAQQAAAAAAAARGGANQTYANVAVSPGASGAVQAAESQLGVPYRWGAESPKGSPDPGFDCSGLTQWSWGQAGVSLPRTAQEQYDAIPHVAMSDVQPGDLIFWNDGTDSVQHVGMYVGNGDVIDAPQTGQDVQIQPIWTNGLVGAGRP